MLLKKITIICVAILILLSACSSNNIPEPERCSLCDDLSRHAPCIVNLSTGEKIELEIYEPHPFLVGEIAEEQRGGYFSFVRGAGVEGFKLGAESVTVTIPAKADKLNQQYFCLKCRTLLDDFKSSSYVLVDLKDTENPLIFTIENSDSFSMRCYDISITLLEKDNKYEIFVKGTYQSNTR